MNSQYITKYHILDKHELGSFYIQAILKPNKTIKLVAQILNVINPKFWKKELDIEYFSKNEPFQGCRCLDDALIQIDKFFTDDQVDLNVASNGTVGIIFNHNKNRNIITLNQIQFEKPTKIPISSPQTNFNFSDNFQLIIKKLSNLESDIKLIKEDLKQANNTTSGELKNEVKGLNADLFEHRDSFNNLSDRLHTKTSEINDNNSDVLKTLNNLNSEITNRFNELKTYQNQAMNERNMILNQIADISNIIKPHCNEKQFECLKTMNTTRPYETTIYYNPNNTQEKNIGNSKQNEESAFGIVLNTKKGKNAFKELFGGQIPPNTQDQYRKSRTSEINFENNNPQKEELNDTILTFPIPNPNLERRNTTPNLNSYMKNIKYNQQFNMEYYYNLFKNYIKNDRHGIRNGNYQFKLIYASERDGDSALDFHRNVDKYKPTLTIIEDDSGNYFGGYTTKSWKSENTFDNYKDDEEAFIFKGKEVYKIDDEQINRALNIGAGKGPCFGEDIIINDNFCQMNTNFIREQFKTYTGNSFNFNQNNSNRNFTVKYMEVYLVEKNEE